MKNINVKYFVYILLAMSACIWFGLAQATGSDLSEEGVFFGLLRYVVTIDVAIISVFMKWGWKWRILKGWLVPFPNLSGTWIGEIRSDWKDPQTGNTLPPIPTMLTVKQSFFSISCAMHTGEMRSTSYVEGFHLDSERQLKQIVYSYTSTPRLSVLKRSAPHDGTVVFDLIERPDRKLVGRYWTVRKTTGEIALGFHCKDLLEELPKELDTHPLINPKS